MWGVFVARFYCSGVAVTQEVNAGDHASAVDNMVVPVLSTANDFECNHVVRELVRRGSWRLALDTHHVNPLGAPQDPRRDCSCGEPGEEQDKEELASHR